METPRSGFIGRIPVRNLWLLMLYASDLYREIGSATRSIEDNPDDIPDLVAAMLIATVERRLQRNLTLGYRHRVETLTRVRGRIDHMRTESRMLLSQGRIACIFDELCIDTPRNRFVRSALLRLSSLASDQVLRARCLSLAARLWEAGVTGESPDRQKIASETFGRNDSADRQMVNLARLAFDLALPTEEQGPRHMATPDRDEYWVRHLFERAVGGFYAYTLDSRIWQVRTGTRLQWPVTRQTARVDEFFPDMQTDIILENKAAGVSIVIDTKFTEIVQSGWHRTKTFKSGYIYQMYAYLRSQEKPEDAKSMHTTGVLLHPSVGSDCDESIEMQGHQLRFMTVDLTATARDIRHRLLELIA
jgi:5-methylcytosine-specific restriction enzyme subunit McrC